MSVSSISASAQGVTTGAISGVVTDQSGVPIESAQIQVTNRSNGAVTGGITRENGRYTVQGLEVGGPYTVVIRRIGFEPSTRNDITVALSQASRVDVRLVKQATLLTAVAVTAETSDTEISPTKTGISTRVSDSSLRRLPSLNRNFTDFVTLTPQISTSGPGASGGGVNNRYNNIQIDGASENDLFGLGSTGQPGGQARGKSISVESVKEYQVELSPFDIRQGNFAGAQVNAVTKSGTNNFHGSVYGFTRNQNFSRNLPIIRQNIFLRQQSGFSLGGPIIKDRLHFFINSEWQKNITPASGPYLGQPAGAATAMYVAGDSITRFQNVLNGYGITAGSPGKEDNHNPLKNIFFRVDAALPWNSRLVVHHNYGAAEDEVFSRSSFPTGVFSLSSNKYHFVSHKRGTVAELFTNFANGSSNELFYAYNIIRDRRAPLSSAPMVSVVTKQAGGNAPTLRAGAENFSQGNELDQNAVEITDNYTIPIAAHTFTIGARAELSRFRNLFGANSYGNWTFSSIDSLANGIATSYFGGVALGGDANVRFREATYSLYAQDLWQATNNLNFTIGVRVDDPTFKDHPAFNPLVAVQTGRSTDEIPSGNFQWSPRVGFNWDINGNQRSQLRGGAGIFVGRPAYVWVSNLFGNNGLAGFAGFSCFSANKPPAFNAASIATPPTACGDGSTAKNAGDINLMSKNVKFPSNFRASLGFDKRLGSTWTATFEGLYTHAINEIMYVQRAFTAGPPLMTTRERDRNGRIMYGSIPTSGIPVTNYRSSRLGVYDAVNESKDYSYNLTAGLQKRFSSRFELATYYTYSHSYSVTDLTSSIAASNWKFARGLGDLGNQEDAYLTVSKFDQPHRLLAYGTYSLPTKTDISFIYRGESGSPFDYIYTGSSNRGDANADGTNSDDLIYVPKSASDPAEIQFATTLPASATAADKAQNIADQQAAFDKFINSLDCLREQRGSIMKRNTCRSPWTNNLDVSLRQSLAPFGSQNLSFQLDVFNFLNLLNKNWGEQQSSGAQGSASLLTQTGQTAGPIQTSQGIYTFNTKFTPFVTDTFSSNYRLQLSLRYSF